MNIDYKTEVEEYLENRIFPSEDFYYEIRLFASHLASKYGSEKECIGCEINNHTCRLKPPSKPEKQKIEKLITRETKCACNDNAICAHHSNFDRAVSIKINEIIDRLNT